VLFSAGLDIAYISNGYVYHTMFDSPEMIPEGCIQRGGMALHFVKFLIFQNIGCSSLLCVLVQHFA